MSAKINSHICLMLSVYKSFHQTVKYGRKRNLILQDLTGLEIQIYEPKTSLKPIFNNRKQVFQIPYFSVYWTHPIISRTYIQVAGFDALCKIYFE